jgi:hypothetical protein
MNDAAKQRRGADDEARGERVRRRDVRREGFRGPAADTRLGEAFLDAISIVAAVGFAADVSQCVQLCGTTFRAGDRGATIDMLVQSLRLQCGAREARAAGRQDFLRHAKDVNDDDDEDDVVEGTTQLIRAAALNNLPRVLQLIQLGAPLDLVEKTWGWSALHWASRKGHEHVVKALLDGKHEGCGATVNMRAKTAWTALMSASFNGHESVVRLLLSRGAKQELQNNGYTALHWAVEGGRPGVVAMLCAAPGAAAALALKTDALHGRCTPLALAIHLGHAKCEAVLRAHGASA